MCSSPCYFDASVGIRVRKRTRRSPLNDKTIKSTKSSLNPQKRENN
jgi:hypothetical protein